MAISIIRNVDSQGRLIIPADIRKEMGIHADTALEISTEGDSIRIRKCLFHRPRYKEIVDFLKILYANIKCGIALCSFDQILATQGVSSLTGAETTEELRTYILEGRERFFRPGDPLCYPAKDYHLPVSALFPIRSPHVSALLLLMEPGREMGEFELGCTRLVAKVITNKYK